MRRLPKQAGMSMTSVLAIAVFVCFFAYIVMKIGPAYMTNHKINKILTEVADQAARESFGAGEIMNRIDARFNTDYIDIVSARKDLAISKGEGYKELSISYQLEIPLFLNISALLDFNNVAEY